MKILSCEIDGRRTYGLVDDGGIRQANANFREKFADLRAVLEANVLGELAENCVDERVEIEAVTHLPPIPNPDKIICVGVNYRPHVEEMGREIPERPMLFVRFPGSLVGHEQALVKPHVSEQFDFEGELAVVIGRPARQVSRSDALDYIAGYSGFMDGSVRDWQRHTSQFTPGKNFRSSGSMGPYLVTPEDVGDVSRLPIETTVSGASMQRATLSDLIFDIPTLVEYCSTFTDLLPGDVIATGTPGGVGAARVPPRWLVDGDRVSVDVGAVGTLTNSVRAE